MERMPSFSVTCKRTERSSGILIRAYRERAIVDLSSAIGATPYVAPHIHEGRLQYEDGRRMR